MNETQLPCDPVDTKENIPLGKLARGLELPRYREKELPVRACRSCGWCRGGPRLADFFFPILPENLTSHPVRKTKIFSCERQKKIDVRAAFSLLIK